MTEAAIIFFLITLPICYFVVTNSMAVRGVSERFADFLLTKAFPSTAEFEHNKFGFLRIIFGYLLLNRAINIFVLLLPSEYFTAAGLWSIADIIAAIFVMAGFMTQWALAFLMFFMWHVGERVMATSTLGNDIAACLALLLFLTNSGKFLSLDALIVSRCQGLGRWLLYQDGIPNQRTLALAKFTALLGYFVVCVFSVAVHLNEHAWMSGIAGPYILSNNFMSSPYQFFTKLFVDHKIAVDMARYSIWIMMLWYPTIIPFTLAGGILRSYTIYWGLAFLFLSSFVLNLGSLAEFEFVFWAGLFWANTGLSSQRKLSVYFDDKCNLCDRTMWLITRLDIFNRIKLCPLSTHGHQLQALGVKEEAALENLYGVQDGSGEIKFGYDFYLMLAKNLFLLWPVLPVLYVGRLLAVGPAIYSAIAKRRRDMFGICTLPSKKLLRQIPVVDAGIPTFTNAVVVHGLLLAVMFCFAIPAPYIGYAGYQTPGAVAAAFYGMTPINVFNHEDMRLAENWFTIKDAKTGTLLPIFTEDGARLKMHRSDRIYFGNTLLFRRAERDKSGCDFDKWQATMVYLSKVYLHSVQAVAGAYSFEYVQYHRDLPDDKKIIQGEYIVADTVIRCTNTFKINYEP